MGLIDKIFRRKEEKFEFPESKEMSVQALGYYAMQVYKNPALDAAFKKAEMDLFNAWRSSLPKDTEARERLFYRLEGLAQARMILAGFVANMLVEDKIKAGQSEQEAQKETV